MRKDQTEKIICVPIDDPMSEAIQKFSDINPHLTREIKHFFTVYKDLEDKEVTIGDWGDEN